MQLPADPKPALGSGEVDDRYGTLSYLFKQEHLKRIADALEKLVEQNEHRAAAEKSGPGADRENPKRMDADRPHAGPTIDRYGQTKARQRLPREPSEHGDTRQCDPTDEAEDYHSWGTRTKTA